MEPEAPDFNPYQPPAVPILDSAAPEGESDPLPWEDPERFPGFWQRLGGMFSLAFSHPRSYGTRVLAGSGLLKPWTFILTLASPFVILMALLLGLMGLVFGLASREAFKDVPGWLLPLLALGLVVLLPAFYFVQMILWGLLNHACLWMWGGVRPGRGLEGTLRLTGYGLAFLTLGSLIPLVNYAVFLAVPVVLGMALARMHGTETWRGICAALTPLLLCCLVYVAWFVVLFTFLPKG